MTAMCRRGRKNTYSNHFLVPKKALLINSIVCCCFFVAFLKPEQQHQPPPQTQGPPMGGQMYAPNNQYQGAPQGNYNYPPQQAPYQAGSMPPPPMGGNMPGGGLRQPYPNMPPGNMPPQQQQMGPGMQQQMGPGMQPPPPMNQYPSQEQQQPKMDMDQIPNPIEVMNVNNSKYGSGESFETNEAGKMPPLITTDFVCKDMGNCNPRFMRSTVYSVPSNPDLLKQSKMPIALNLTPFAELRAEEREPPVADLGELGPVRCKRCKAYMSPFMSFIDNGNLLVTG